MTGEPDAPGALKDAIEWLSDVMEAEPRIDSRDVKAAAAKADIAPTTLGRARKKLGIVIRRRGSGKTASSEWMTAEKADETDGEGL